VKTTTANALTNAQFTLTAASVGAAVLPHLLRLPLIFSVPIAALLVGRWFQRQYTTVRVPIWIKLPLIILFPILIIFHYGNIFGREPGSALACTMLTLKLIETDNRRDARAAVCFSGFVLMSALLFDSDLLFTLLLLAALSLILAALRSLEPRPLDASPPTIRLALREGMRVSVVALLAAIPLALCVFLFFPRLGSPLWGAPTDTAARTGLGDRMSPGTIQDLLIDDSPAFRVDFHGAAPSRPELYWRGPVLSYFDGRTWSRTELYRLRGTTDLRTSGASVTYDVTLEPSDRRWLLALDVPLTAPGNSVRGADMSLINRAPIDTVLQYQVTSATHYELDSSLGDDDRRRALELPYDFNPRSRELAAGWRASFKNDTAIIRAALELFHERFFYTLDAPLLARDSVDDFLFNTQRGFCEHYASAFTFLMRAAGIPARVVTGYQGGYYNRVGGYWVVRQSDAHAWSEVWLQGRGWVRIDPTAAVSPQRVELGSRAAAGESARWYQASWMQAVRNQFDLVNRVWNEAIVQFSALRQQSMLTPFGVDKADYGSLMAVLIGTSSLLLIAFAWWVLRMPRVRDDALDAAYGKLRAKLDKAGAASTPAEGPLTLAERTRTLWPEDRHLALAFLNYVRLRYGCQRPEDEDVRAFAQSIASLRLLTVSRAK
jgi:transglutaminase-like putative cysteine protease